MPLIALSQIQIPNIAELNPAKLHALLHSFDSFEDQLNSKRTPIAISITQGTPYQIMDGRHRIYTAHKMGIEKVNVIFA